MSTPPMSDEYPTDEEQANKQLVKVEPVVEYPLARTSDDLEILNGDSEENLYAGISTAIVTQEQELILRKPVDVSIVEINPMGEVYVPHSEYRKTLCDAFHSGGWGIRPVSKPTLYGNWLMQWYSLYVGGKFISTVPSEAQYFPDNPRMVYATALESLRSVALRRLCKDLGMFLECWDKAFIFKFKSENCIQVEYLDNKGKVSKGWRKKDSPPMDGEVEYAQVVARRNAQVKRSTEVPEKSEKRTQPTAAATVSIPSGESEKKESPKTVVESVKPAEMIVVDSKGTEKPRRETIGVKVASSDWFKSHILGHKHFLDKSNHPVQKHFTAYILKYFGINSAVNLTWEMFVAMRNNLDGKGDDPKYYKPEAKEIEPTEPKSIEDRIKDAGLSKLVAEWKASYHIRPDSDHRDFIEMVEIILEGIGNGHFSTSTPEGLKEIDEQFRVAFKEVPF